MRAESQGAEDSIRALTARYGLNVKTVSERRKHPMTDNAPMGPRHVHSTELTVAEEAAMVEFRRRSGRALNDLLGCLRQHLPQLSRSALHRCLVRHEISRLPAPLRGRPSGGTSQKRGSGTCVHIDASEVRSAA